MVSQKKQISWIEVSKQNNSELWFVKTTNGWYPTIRKKSCEQHNVFACNTKLTA